MTACKSPRKCWSEYELTVVQEPAQQSRDIAACFITSFIYILSHTEFLPWGEVRYYRYCGKSLPICPVLHFHGHSENDEV